MKKSALASLCLVGLASFGCWAVQLAGMQPTPGSTDPMPLRAVVVSPHDSAENPDDPTESSRAVRILREANLFASVEERTANDTGAAFSVSVIEPGGAGVCDLGPAGLLPLLTLGLIPARGSVEHGWKLDVASRLGGRHNVDARVRSVCWVGWFPAFANFSSTWTLSPSQLRREEDHRLLNTLLDQRDEIERLWGR